MKTLILTTLLAGSALSVSAQKEKSQLDTLVVTTTPQMHCNGCEEKIKQNIRFVKGTKKILTSLSKQEVTLIYDRRKAKPDDYKAAFAKLTPPYNKSN